MGEEQLPNLMSRLTRGRPKATARLVLSETVPPAARMVAVFTGIRDSTLVTESSQVRGRTLPIRYDRCYVLAAGGSDETPCRNVGDDNRARSARVLWRVR
jgi:hypothetical protein